MKFEFCCLPPRLPGHGGSHVFATGKNYLLKVHTKQPAPFLQGVPVAVIQYCRAGLFISNKAAILFLDL